MKIEILREIIKKDASKDGFAVLTNISSGNSEIFELGKPLSKEFINYKKEIEDHYNLKKNGIIKDTQIFIENHNKPIEVIILGAVHIAQYLIDFIKNFNFNVTVIDPRKYFTSNQRFENTKIINDWPKEAFKTIKTNSHTALIALTHDPKIDDPALQHALKK